MLLTFRYSKVLLFAELNIISFVLVQLREIKIILGAVGALVVELEHAYVLLLNLHSSIGEWVCGMLASGHWIVLYTLVLYEILCPLAFSYLFRLQI